MVMTDTEFNDLIDRLFELSKHDGDLGHEYWTRVIKQLKEMRQVEASVAIKGT